MKGACSCCLEESWQISTIMYHVFYFITSLLLNVFPSWSAFYGSLSPSSINSMNRGNYLKSVNPDTKAWLSQRYILYLKLLWNQSYLLAILEINIILIIITAMYSGLYFTKLNCMINKIHTICNFPRLAPSTCITFWRYTHIVTRIRISSLFQAKQYSIVWRDDGLFIHLSVCAYLTCLCFLAC